MNLQKFENVVRSGLRNQEVPVNTDELIHKLFSPEKPKRRLAYLWWFLGVITISVGIGIFSLKSKTDIVPLQKGVQQNLVLQSDNNKKSNTSNSGFESPENKSQTHTQNIFQQISKNSSKSNPIKNNSKNVKKNSHALNNYVTGQAGKEIYTSAPVSVYLSQQKLQGAEFISSLALKSPISLVKPKRPGRKKVECPSFSNKKKISIFVQPEFGMSLPQKTLTENIPDNSETTVYRKEHEKTLEGIHAGVIAGCFIGSTPLYVYTGLGYSRFTEKLDLTYQYTRLDTTFGIISITQSQSGDTVTVIYGDIITESTISGQKIKHHQFQTFDIPICAGYQFAFGKKWNANVEGGILLNISLKASGQILESLHDFKPIVQNEYHSSLGLGYRAGAGVEYLVMPSLGIGLQARVQGYGKSFSNANAGFQQKYFIPGGNLYLRYYFSL